MVTSNHTNTHPAIIYNTSYNGLSIIQELGSMGVPCIAVDCVYSVGAFSKYARFRRCPNPLKNEDAFVAFLYELCKAQTKKPVLFPTNDEWALITAKHKKKLSEVAIPCVSSFETTELILSKDKFYKAGDKAQYMTPKSWDEHTVKAVSKKEFPIIAKPKYKTVPYSENSTLINKILSKNRLTIIRSQNELLFFFAKHQEMLSHFVFQEYVSGNSSNMFTVGVYADRHSKIKGTFTGRKVRGYPADIGDNILGESHYVPAELIQNTEKIVRDLSFEGIAEFEYKKDEAKGHYKLIEINPRPWSWIGITQHCNVNLPLIAYKNLIGQESKAFRSTAKTGEVKYVKIYQDFFNCLVRYRFNYRPWYMSYKKWRASINAKKLVVAEWNKKDWGVAIASIPYLIGKILFQKWRGTTNL